ncbi:MAG: hypothetical protein DRP86_07680 [Candidatus Neomarinimicrobiota bacterium]|nr:hypothetical protein [Candidatus Neomarinimicrobiota bacterium]RKY47473.1 MAG: hypothetical protein DRP86_07680 [Candidatus Neomarinimicrobiota bacterium]
MKKMILVLVLFSGILSCTHHSSSANDSVKIVVTGNSRAKLEPCGCRIPAGGLPRRMGFIYSMEKGWSDFMKIEAGNWLFPAYNAPETAPQSWKQKSGLLAKAYGEAHYDAINVGFTDLSHGYEYLLELQKENKLPFLSTNLLNETGETLFKPFYLFNQKGLRIAVMGVTYLTDDQASRFKSLTPEDAIRKQLPKLRNEADLILILADMPLDKTEELGETIPEIDFIVNSRHKGRTQLPRQTGGKAVYTYLGPDGQYVGILKVVFNAPGQPVRDISGAYHRLDFSKGRLAEYRERAGDTPVETYYKDNPGLLRTIRVYEKEVERQQSILDTTQNYFIWSMRHLDSGVYSHPEWEKAVNEVLMKAEGEKN